MVGNTHSESALVGDEVRSHSDSTRQNECQRLGRHLHNLEGDARSLVDVADNHICRCAQYEHRLLILALFECVNLGYRLGIRGVATDTPDRIGGVEYQTSVAQYLDCLLYVFLHNYLVKQGG